MINFFSFTLFLTLILLNQASGFELSKVEFEKIVERTLQEQEQHSNLKYRHQLSLYENDKEEVMSIDLSLRKTLRSCLAQALSPQHSRLSFQKLVSSCLPQIKAVVGLPKTWWLKIESLPFSYFPTKELEKLEASQHFTLFEKNSLDAKEKWDSHSIILNNSMTLKQQDYQFVASSMILHFNSAELSNIEMIKIYRIHKKIEALLKLEPPLALNMSELVKKSPLLSMRYFFSLLDGKIIPTKYSLYPGSLYWPGRKILRHHQLTLNKVSGEDQTEVAKVDEIEFDISTQKLSAKGENILQEALPLMLEALQVKALWEDLK